MNLQRSRFHLTFVLAPLLAASLHAADGFPLGVAAGDVTDTSAILWTRADDPGDVTVQVSDDPRFDSLVFNAVAAVGADADQTVRFEATGLRPATRYYYRFTLAVPAQDSPAGEPPPSQTGTFSTAPPPAAATPLRFVFSGDSNFQVAPFVILSHAARESADLFIWYGDTIYADVPAAGQGVATTLDDYRAKYRQLRGDPHVREILSEMAVLVGWDDHEVGNDYAGLDPSLSRSQRDAAYQAFFEHMPIRRDATDPTRTYRRLRYGRNVEVFVLDTRQYRDIDAGAACNNNPDPEGLLLGPLGIDRACVEALRQPRELLGAEQFDWLTSGLAESTATIKFVVNSVPLSNFAILPYDRWDGYDAQRKALLEFIDAAGVEGVVFLTTDLHSNFYNPDVMRHFRLYRPDYALRSGVQVAELVVGPIGTSTFSQTLRGIADRLLGGPESPAAQLVGAGGEALALGKLNQRNGFLFAETDRYAYLVVDVSAAGEVDFTYRGVTPESAQQSDAEIETLYEARLAPAPPLPCCLPLFVLSTCAVFLRRTSSPRS
ncbi:Alkaline phosphatase D precursor [Phycisphaerae bacterium RAS1]|nr:Alkaline phosphatase D precursor [Phycisphaerae bacterium RAS1]